MQFIQRIQNLCMSWQDMVRICFKNISLLVPQVLYKKWVGRVSFGHLSMFLSIMGKYLTMMTS